MLCVQLACFHRGASRHIVTAARDCSELSHDASVVCSQARDKGQAMVQLTQDVRDDLQAGFHGKLDGSVFLKIQDLIETKKTKQALSCLDDMGGMVTQLLHQTQGMGQALNRGIESLPDEIKDDFASPKSVHHSSTGGGGGGTDTYRAMGPEDDAATGHSDDGHTMGDEDEAARLIRTLEQALSTIDTDVDELDNSCSTSRGNSGFNLFTAGTKGSALLEQTANKGSVCRSLWNQMQELCTSLSRMASALVGNGNCCALAASMASGLASLFRCRSLVQVLQQAALAVQKLMASLRNLIQVAWDKFQGFLQEFDAAKKLGRFVNQLDNTKVGQLAVGAVQTGKKATGFMKKLFT